MPISLFIAGCASFLEAADLPSYIVAHDSWDMGYSQERSKHQTNAGLGSRGC